MRITNLEPLKNRLLLKMAKIPGPVSPDGPVPTRVFFTFLALKRSSALIRESTTAASIIPRRR